MANLITTALLTYNGTAPVEHSETEVEINANGCNLTVEHYTSGDVLIGEIDVQQSTVENHDGVNTRIRVWPKTGQVANGEKLKFILDNDL